MNRTGGFALSVVVAALGLGCGESEAGAGARGIDGVASPARALQGGVFDHRHTDLASVPDACIGELKQSTLVFHYAHRSHGSQIIVGAKSLAAAHPKYGFYARYTALPNRTGVLKMWDGMSHSNLSPAEDYWADEAGLADLRSILQANPQIRYTSWAWSFEIQEETEVHVQQYLDTIAELEAEFPDVTFVYQTSPAVPAEWAAVNRTLRNQQIRAFASQGNRVLYDFEDLDSWWNGTQETIVVDGLTIPMEHRHYREAPEYQWTHTSRENCENKARAFWVMLATLEGCARAERGPDAGTRAK